MAFDCGVALPAHVDPVQRFPLDVRHISWDKRNESDIHESFTKPLTDLHNASDFSSLNASEFVRVLISLIWRTCEDNLTVKHASKTSDMRPKTKSKHAYLYSLWKKSYNFERSSEIDSRKAFRTFVKNRLLEEQNEKVGTLCDAAAHNERQFWKLVKGKRHKCQLGTFLINDKFVSDSSEIMKMWFTHFSSLGRAHSNSNYDSNTEVFVRNFTENETENFCALNRDSTGLFDAPPSREEAHLICKSLPKGSSGGYDQITYEHVLYGGPALWDVIYDLFLRFFYDNGSPEMLKICMMLPLFKGKGLKAYDKDNYRGIAMFPVITKIFEMILLKRLEDLARSESYFSLLQFGFKSLLAVLRPHL